MTVTTNPDSYGEQATDQMRVRQLFARTAAVANSAFLRREIADRMHERLALVKFDPKLALDAGCGEGDDLGRLRERFPEAKVIGADISADMLKEARHRIRAIDKVSLLCCDFGRLPMADGAADMLWSNLALHWHASPEQVYAEWLRVLRIGGLLMFSCFGSSTLQELRLAFTGVDSYPHIMSFPDMHELGDRLFAAGCPSPVLDRETITVTYGDVNKLFADVRALGGNALAQRRRGLLGKDAWDRVRQALEQKREADSRIALSFEIVYGHAFRDEPAQKAHRETPVHFMPRRLIADD